MDHRVSDEAVEEKPVETGEGESGHTARMMLVVIALAAGFALVPRAMQSCNARAASGPAPDFTANVVANPLETNQKSFTLSAMRGKPVVLDFWGTWCPSCRNEAPIIDAVTKKFKDSGLVVVGVDVEDPPGMAEAFMAKKGYGYMTVFDEGSAIAKKYDVTLFPTLVFVNKDGKVVAIRHGVTSEADLERLIRTLL